MEIISDSRLMDGRSRARTRGGRRFGNEVPPSYPFSGRGGSADKKIKEVGYSRRGFRGRLEEDGAIITSPPRSAPGDLTV